MSTGDTDTCVAYVMGKRCVVPRGLTITRALEYAGYKLLRGCGCRGGFCGACATVYRLHGDYRLKVGLACQTVVEDGMYLAQIPFFPAPKSIYDIESLPPSLSSLTRHYPELSRCLGCNTCTRACPQGLQVMDFVAAAMRGDLAKVADLSFDCIMCGLCASRCPAEIVQYNVAVLARRLYARHVAPAASHLERRLRQMQEAPTLAQELDRMTSLSREELLRLYSQRDIES